MQENKTSHISFSELKRGWFTINDCYKTVNIHPLPKMEPLTSAEKHLITMAFYAIIFQGKKPKMFPKDMGGALAVFLYNNLTLVRDSSNRFVRAFMESDKLPENIRDAMKPKDECPQQLIETGNELKKWANQLLALNGLNEAFEKSINLVTDEMAKKVGELVANQILSESTKNCKENREHLAELSAKIYLNSQKLAEIDEIYRDSEENKLIALFALLFRLVVQTPKQLMKYYAKKGNKDIIKYPYDFRSRELIKKELCKKCLYDIHQRFLQLRPAITHHVAIGLIAMKIEDDYDGLAHTAYRELKTWFVSRMEFHGLALLKFKEFETLIEARDMFRNIMMTTNANQLIGILSALLIYLCAQSEGEVEVDGNKVVRDMTVWLLAQRLNAQSDDEIDGNETVRDVTAWLLKLLEEPSIDLNIPKFNKYDQFLCKFSKCFSPKYLPWTAFKYNCDTSALLLGYSRGFAPVEEELHGTYINLDRIESFRKDAFISPVFLEALEVAQNDILWRSRKKEGQINIKLIGYLIGKIVWDQQNRDNIIYRELKRMEEEKKAAERKRLLALEEDAKSNTKSNN